jgi:hypothetical protein
MVIARKPQDSPIQKRRRERDRKRETRRAPVEMTERIHEARIGAKKNSALAVGVGDMPP